MTNRDYTDLSNLFSKPIHCENFIIMKNILRENDLKIIRDNWKKERVDGYIEHLKIDHQYVILFDKRTNSIMMSNTEFEKITNQKFVDAAKGDVLTFGLGLGLVIHPLIDAKEVKSITVVEIDKELIDIITTTFKTTDKIKFINQDAFEYTDDKLYDVIYFDIWKDIDNKSFEEMEFMREKFKKNLKPGGWIDCWCSEEKDYESK